ncbi:hypothetical protein GCM10010275_18500 [Streptomyces litmocidini]|nr:hypothetical protein GCM10010275_18500 [Streptomyces litmocidini]
MVLHCRDPDRPWVRHTAPGFASPCALGTTGAGSGVAAPVSAPGSVRPLRDPFGPEGRRAACQPASSRPGPAVRARRERGLHGGGPTGAIDLGEGNLPFYDRPAEGMIVTTEQSWSAQGVT